MSRNLSLFISTFVLMGISLTMSGASLCLSKEKSIRSGIEGETHNEALVSENIRSYKAMDSLYVGSFYNADQGVTLTINLIDTCVVAPNYEFLGKLNGYLWGNLHESWFVTSYQLKEGRQSFIFLMRWGRKTKSCFSQLWIALRSRWISRAAMDCAG